MLFIAGLVPFLWLKTPYLTAKGDDFPFWFLPQRTFSWDASLWAVDNLGHSAIWSTSILYEALWAIPSYIGVPTSVTQIVFQSALLMMAGFSMRYLSAIIYPKLDLVRIVSSLFYMFNLFVVQSRTNVGFAWTYSFLPLMIGLLVRVIESARPTGKPSYRSLGLFSLASTVTLSFSSINPANVAITLIVLSVTTMYYSLAWAKYLGNILLGLVKLSIISLATNIWWMIPIFNYYVLSPTTLNGQISVVAWSWTHARASFLNLFSLNGVWNWRPEYVPYIDSYSSPILAFLVFVPFMLAVSAVLFRTKNLLLNCYLLMSILVMMFLAKGLHEPFGEVNLALYNYIPFMDIFREPASKFTLAIIPFLALLIGFSAHQIANVRIPRLKPSKILKPLAIALLVAMFITISFPLVTNPLETRTSQLPFSSYVSVPDYWYQASGWLNSQSGNFRVLVTPGDDFYQMPYTWGYYGTDQFIERLIQKPILSTYYTYSYKTNSNTTTTLTEIYSSIKYNRTIEFRAFLDLLGVKYIVQRNDIDTSFDGRQITSADEMRAFLVQQQYIHVSRQFGQLDVYEYAGAKPLAYLVDPSTFNTSHIKVENQSLTTTRWDFNRPLDVKAWNESTPQYQFGALVKLNASNGTLEADLWNSTWGWKSLRSPLIPSLFDAKYTFQFDVKGINAYQVHAKVAELDASNGTIALTYEAFVNDGTFDWIHMRIPYQPMNSSTRYLQLQIWNGHETDKPLPNRVLVRNAQITGYVTKLNTTGIDSVFPNSPNYLLGTIQTIRIEGGSRMYLQVYANRPVILGIDQLMDPGWTILGNGLRLQVFPLFLGMIGVNITNAGLTNIVLDYTPQKVFLIGIGLSAVAVLGSIGFVFTSGKVLRRLIALSIQKFLSFSSLIRKNKPRL